MYLWHEGRRERQQRGRLCRVWRRFEKRARPLRVERQVAAARRVFSETLRGDFIRGRPKAPLDDRAFVWGRGMPGSENGTGLSTVFGFGGVEKARRANDNDEYRA